MIVHSLHYNKNIFRQNNDDHCAQTAKSLCNCNYCRFHSFRSLLYMYFHYLAIKFHPDHLVTVHMSLDRINSKEIINKHKYMYPDTIWFGFDIDGRISSDNIFVFQQLATFDNRTWSNFILFRQAALQLGQLMSIKVGTMFLLNSINTVWFSCYITIIHQIWIHAYYLQQFDPYHAFPGLSIAWISLHTLQLKQFRMSIITHKYLAN